jgi:hypothetical protein
MKYLSWFALTAAFLAAGASWAGDPPKGGTVVELSKLKSQTPAAWKAEKPANNLRSHQFRLPRAKDDDADAELSILPEALPPASAAVARWKDLFQPPKDKTLDDISKVDTFEVGKVKVTYLDIRGTYLQLPRPLAPKKDAKLRPNYRMLAVFFDTPDGAHTIRLVGPATTVEQHKAAFDEWLKNFK